MLTTDPQTTMTQLERLLLEEATGGVDPHFLMRTDTRIDAGRWWRGSPLWLCVMPGDVVVFAVGRRRYLERIPITGCGAGFYNHATGELVLAPAEALRFRQFRMKPSAALRILSLLSSKTNHSTQHP